MPPTAAERFIALGTQSPPEPQGIDGAGFSTRLTDLGPFNPFDVRYGVNVEGSVCGVFASSEKEPLTSSDRGVSLNGVGVFARGHNVGVIGRGETGAHLSGNIGVAINGTLTGVRVQSQGVGLEASATHTGLKVTGERFGASLHGQQAGCITSGLVGLIAQGQPFGDERDLPTFTGVGVKASGVYGTLVNAEKIGVMVRPHSTACQQSLAALQIGIDVEAKTGLKIEATETGVDVRAVGTPTHAATGMTVEGKTVGARFKGGFLGITVEVSAGEGTAGDFAGKLNGVSARGRTGVSATGSSVGVAVEVAPSGVHLVLNSRPGPLPVNGIAGSLCVAGGEDDAHLFFCTRTGKVDAEGNPLLDEEGRPILDANGDPIIAIWKEVVLK